MGEKEDAEVLFEALENLHGDLYLLGLCETKLEDIYEGSQRDAVKALKRLQQYRRDDLKPLAIGQKPRAGINS